MGASITHRVWCVSSCVRVPLTDITQARTRHPNLERYANDWATEEIVKRCTARIGWRSRPSTHISRLTRPRDEIRPRRARDKATFARKKPSSSKPKAKVNAKASSWMIASKFWLSGERLIICVRRYGGSHILHLACSVSPQLFLVSLQRFHIS